VLRRRGRSLAFRVGGLGLCLKDLKSKFCRYLLFMKVFCTTDLTFRKRCHCYNRIDSGSMLFEATLPT
jgi:hypothetical protein